MPEQSFQATPPLYSEQLKTKGKIYFFDIKAAKNGNKYLSISETWIKDGQKHRSNITVFQDNMQEFTKAISQMQDKVKA